MGMSQFVKNIQLCYAVCPTWSVESVDASSLPAEWQKRFWQIEKIDQILKIYPKL
jgi:Fe-S-cluster-containing hydrogenase component 2